MRKDLVTLLGLDTVREKTLYQTRWLAAHGFDVDILTIHRNVISIDADASARIVQIPPGALPRLRQLVRYVRENRARLHHVELYVGGRFAFVYALACRLMGVTVLALERGDLLFCMNRTYPLATRLSIYLSYRLSNAVWLREPYMRRAFARWRVRGTFFLPNGIPLPPAPPPGGARPTDLLWVNRLIPVRHPEWFAAAVAELAATRIVRCEVFGFWPERSDPGTPEVEQEVRRLLEPLEGVSLQPFSKPGGAFLRSRFFVLTADAVFGNFGLLEAMANGAVPIVSDVEGSGELIEHGRNGFLVEHRADALLPALERALDLPEEEWSRMSEAARETVVEHYSIDTWGERLLGHYEAIG